MNKKLILVFIASYCMITASAQTLFTYGKYTADAKDFLRAYNKNNTQPVANKTKAMHDYLDLYIKSRLKIQEAYERGYDTLPQIKSEVDNLRSQIVENYISDPGTVDRLLKEALERSLKDIHVAHIFISFKNINGINDTLTAQTKINQVVQRLQKGEDFTAVAQQTSDDPSVKTNKGDIGYVTVFSLPYEFENVIYATPIGKYSSTVRSKIGYHIFKILGERPAVGKIKAQQILLAFPPGIDEAGKKQIAAKADSLYKKIIAGADFSKLAATFSNDYVSAANGGTMPDIGVGQYDPVFESVLWALPKNGAVSKPFLTSHGWHIVKRIELKPVVRDLTNADNKNAFQQKITADGRWRASRDFIYARVLSVAGLKTQGINETALWAYSDSLLDTRPLQDIGRIMTRQTVLFKVGDSAYDADEWITYAQAHRFKPDGSGTKPYGQVMDEFINSSLYNYYRDNLESFNEEFRNQMSEFRDGNLFFEIMQREIWNKAQADSVALVNLYEKNKKNYTWKQSADAVILFCSDLPVAKSVYDQIKRNPSAWRKITEAVSEKVVTDSSRYEWNQIPNLNKLLPRPGMITSPLVNKNDNTASFAYIVRTYTQPMQRNFNEAKGLVINDYQTLLEDQWIAELKKKYPVKIDEAVLAAISK